MKSLISRHPKASYYIILAVAVTIMYFAVQAYMIASGKELIWSTDSKPLYVNFLLWGQAAIGEFFKGIADGQGIVLPMYTYSLGYGADAIGSMGSYLQDPINLIVFMMPAEMIGISYPLMNLVRFYLAAVAFSVYCFGRGHGYKATGVASLLYLTCGFILFLGVIRHPKFLDWAILLPLALRAVDKIFEGRGYVMFVVVLFLQFFTSIYYTYMTVFVLVGYFLVKYFFVPRDRSLPGFLKLVGICMGLAIVAFLLSGPFSMTQVSALLSQSRATGGSSGIDMLFNVKYYMRIPAHLIGSVAEPEGMISCGVGLIGALAFLLCRKRFDPVQWRAWTIGLAICAICVLFPFFGHLLNGMGYCTDRWMLLLGFVSAYVFCLTYPQLGKLDRAEWKRVTIGVAVVVALVLIYVASITFRTDAADEIIWPSIMVVVFIAAFAVIRHVQSTRGGTAVAACAMGLVIIFCAAASTGIYCSSLGVHWVGGYAKPGAIYNYISTRNPAVAVQQTGDDGLYRYSGQRVLATKNSALNHEPMMGVDYYTSYYNQSVADFRKSLGIGDHHMSFSFAGSDSRLAIDAITGVKYYVCQDEDLWRVEPGYEDTGVVYKKYHVFQNQNPVPLAFLAPGIIDVADYDAMTMTQREEALMQGAVVDASKVSEDLKRADVELSSTEVPFTVVKATDGEYEDGVFRAKKDDSTLEIEFDESFACDTYLTFENLSYSGYSPSKLVELNDDTPGMTAKLRDVFWIMPNEYPISAAIGTRTGAIDPVTAKHRRYGGKKDWVINLGEGVDGKATMTITFGKRGEYTFDSMKVVKEPFEPIIARSNALADAALQDFEMHRNGMSATAVITDNQAHLAQFMVAYGSGWSVTVDGQPAQAVKVDKGFLGVEVRGNGEHDIAWSYETPGLRTGAAMLVVGVVVCLAAGAFYMLRRRKTA